MEYKNSNSTYKIHNKINEKVSFCKQFESNSLSPTIDDTCRKICKRSEVSSLEQVRTSSIVYNTEGLISSEDLHHLYGGIRNLKSKGSDLDSSYGEIESKGSSGSRVVSGVKSDLDKCSSVMSDKETVHTSTVR